MADTTSTVANPQNGGDSLKQPVNATTELPAATDATTIAAEPTAPTSTSTTNTAAPEHTGTSKTNASVDAPAPALNGSTAQPAEAEKAAQADEEPAGPAPENVTPTLEKDLELDFVGNVDVNDDIPTEVDLKRVGDLLVLDSHGQSRPFKELYDGEGNAPRQLIIFIRHFFCGNCQEYLRTISSSITPDSLLALETPAFITVIGCGRPELIDMYIKETSCPFPVYADPTRKLYDYLGMTRTLDPGKKPEYIQSNMFLTSVQSVLQGLKTGNKALKGGDFKQVGGEFLFENGKCIWTHRMRNTRDHEEVESIRELLGLEVKKPPMRKRWSHGIKEEKDGRARSSSWGRVRGISRSKTYEKAKTKDQEKEKGSGDVTQEATPRESAELKLNNGTTV